MKNFKKISKLFAFWLILIFIVIIIIVIFKKDYIAVTFAKGKYQKQGYYICQSFDCTSKKLNTCEKSFFRIDLGGKYIEEFVYEDQGECVFKVFKSDKLGLECQFDKTDLGALPKITISNYKLFPETKDVCKIVQY